MDSEEVERLFPQANAKAALSSSQESVSDCAHGPRSFSSSDAYFLIYRQASMNAPAMKDADIPEPHWTEIRSDNEELLQLQEAFVLQRKLLEVKVFAPSASHTVLARHVGMQLGSLCG